MVHGYMGDNCSIGNISTDIPSLYNSNADKMATRSISISSMILDRTMLRDMNTNTENKFGIQAHGTDCRTDGDAIKSSVNLLNRRVAINYVPQLGLFSILNPMKY